MLIKSSYTLRLKPRYISLGRKGGQTNAWLALYSSAQTKLLTITPLSSYLFGGSDPQRFSVVPPVRMVLIRIISDEEIFFVLDVKHIVVNHSICSRVQTCTYTN